VGAAAGAAYGHLGGAGAAEWAADCSHHFGLPGDEEDSAFMASKRLGSLRHDTSQLRSVTSAVSGYVRRSMMRSRSSCAWLLCQMMYRRIVLSCSIGRRCR
jgi:hypothetical protein